MKRRKMSGNQSRKDFRKKSGTKVMNVMAAPMRGGIRL